jgi:hypothetical protein
VLLAPSMLKLNSALQEKETNAWIATETVQMPTLLELPHVATKSGQIWRGTTKDAV